MNAIPPSNAAQARNGPALPENMGCLLNQHILISLILNSTHGVDPGRLQPVAAPNAGVAFQPRSLLVLLTYCYLSGIFGSQDVERTMEKDVLLRLVCNNEYPDWHLIRRFRRHNREVLHRCLELSCTRALQAVSSSQGLAALEKSCPLLQSLAAETKLPSSPEIAVPKDVENRIEKALWLDSLSLDD